MSTVRDLLVKYQHIISGIHIVGGSKGIFDVLVDGKALFSKHAEGRHAEPGEVLERFVGEYAQGVRPYEK